MNFITNIVICLSLVLTTSVCCPYLAKADDNEPQAATTTEKKQNIETLDSQNLNEAAFAPDEIYTTKEN